MRTRFLRNRDWVLQRALKAAELLNLQVTNKTDSSLMVSSIWWAGIELHLDVRQSALMTELEVEVRARNIWQVPGHSGPSQSSETSPLPPGMVEYAHDVAVGFIEVVRRGANTTAVVPEPVEVPASGVASTPGADARGDARQEWKEWKGDLSDADAESSDEYRRDSLPFGVRSARVPRGVRQRVARSLCQWARESGLAAKDATWHGFEDAIEALGDVSSDLPVFVQTPRDKEIWLEALAESWDAIPGIKAGCAKAIDENRQKNGRWFQEHGFGGN